MRTVNSEILDRAIKHAVFLEGLKTSEIAELMKIFNADIFPDLIKKVRRLTEGGAYPKTIKAAIRNDIRSGISLSRQQLQSRMSALGVSEANWNKSLMDATWPVNHAWNTPGSGLMRSIIKSKPFEGKLFGEWFQRIEKNTQHRIETAIQTGLVRGDSIDQMVSRLRGTKANGFLDGVFQTTRREAQTIVRTSVNHVSNQARKAFAEENQDVIKAIQIVATLDDRTSDICQSLDGRVFKIEEAQYPPFHHQCRSTTIFVTKSFKELGIDIADKDVKLTRAAKQYDSLGNATRGEVPAKVYYGDWLKTQPKATQRTVLGSKFDLWSSGNITVNQFTDARFIPRTKAQLMSLAGPEVPRLKGEIKNPEIPIPLETPVQAISLDSYSKWVNGLPSAQRSSFKFLVDPNFAATIGRLEDGFAFKGLQGTTEYKRLLGKWPFPDTIKDMNLNLSRKLDDIHEALGTAPLVPQTSWRASAFKPGLVKGDNLNVNFGQFYSTGDDFLQKFAPSEPFTIVQGNVRGLEFNPGSNYVPKGGKLEIVSVNNVTINGQKGQILRVREVDGALPPLSGKHGKPTIRRTQPLEIPKKVDYDAEIKTWAAKIRNDPKLRDAMELWTEGDIGPGFEGSNAWRRIIASAPRREATVIRGMNVHKGMDNPQLAASFPIGKKVRAKFSSSFTTRLDVAEEFAEVPGQILPKMNVEGTVFIQGKIKGMDISTTLNITEQEFILTAGSKIITKEIIDGRQYLQRFGSGAPLFETLERFSVAQLQDITIIIIEQVD